MQAILLMPLAATSKEVDAWPIIILAGLALVFIIFCFIVFRAQSKEIEEMPPETVHEAVRRYGLRWKYGQVPRNADGSYEESYIQQARTARTRRKRYET